MPRNTLVEVPLDSVAFTHYDAPPPEITQWLRDNRIQLTHMIPDGVDGRTWPYCRVISIKQRCWYSFNNAGKAALFKLTWL